MGPIQSILFFAWVFLLGSTHLPGQSLKNGDFSKGGSSWSGSNYKVEDDPANPGNKVLVVQLSTKDKGAEFGQDITIKRESHLTIEFEVKPSADYAGDGFTVAISSPKGFSIPMKFSPPRKEGQRYTVNLTSDKLSDRARFTIKLGVFVGKLYFDNFTSKS